MNFPLSEIELHVREEYLVEGEQLLEQGRVGNFSELERHLWLIEVSDTNSLEVEVRISPSKVTQGSCECARFRNEGECPHFVAALLALRRRLSDQQEKKKTAPSKKERPARSLSTGIILDHIRPEDLADFVRQYAKANRGFAVALKSRFAPDVPASDNKAKFSELLESAISMSRKADRSISYRGIKKILTVLEEMHGQMKQALALKHLADAVDMALSIIEKITPLIRKAGDRQEELRQTIRSTFGILQEITTINAPPALLDSLWSFTSEECKKLIYRNTGIDRYFFKLLASLSDSSLKEEALRLLITAQLDKYLSEGRDPAALVMLQLQRLEHLGKSMEAQELVEKYLSAPEVLLFAVRNASEKGDWPRMVQLAEAGLKMQPPQKVVAELEDILLQEAIRSYDIQRIVHLANARFFKTLDIKYYRIAKTALGKHWKKHPENILEQLRRLPFSLPKRSIIAAVLAEEHRNSELLTHLREARSLDLLVQYGALLALENEGELLDLYRQLLGQFLRGHVGPKPSQRVREIVQHLQKTGATGIADRLVTMIRAEYPERHTLQEELQIF